MSEKTIMQDVDDTTDQMPGELSEGEGTLTDVSGTIEDTIPIPQDSGKSFMALLAAWLGGIALSFVVAKGWMSPSDSTQFALPLQGVIFSGLAWVTTRFLKSRSEVKVAALRASAVRATAFRPSIDTIRGSAAVLKPFAGPMGGFSGFSLQGLMGMLATINTMVNFMPLDAKTKSLVRKSVNAAIAAIKGYQEN